MGKSIEMIPAGVMDALKNFHRPGNIREPENFLEGAVFSSSGPKLRLADELERPSKDLPRSDRTLADVEREYIVQVLNQVKWKPKFDSCR